MTIAVVAIEERRAGNGAIILAPLEEVEKS